MACRILQPAQRLQHQALGALIAQRLGRAGHIGADLLGRLHGPAPDIQRRFLAGFGVQLVQFGHGMAQEFLFGPHGGQCAFGQGQRLLRRAPARPGRAQRCQIQPGEDIQHLPVPARVQQPAVIMLTVQFHQPFRQCPQHLARNPAVIDPGGLAAIGIVHPAQDQIALGLDPVFFQHGMGRMARRQVEFGHHLALFGAAPHQLGPATPAQHKAQAIQQNGFASPGFPGQHIQPGLKGQRQPVDNQHVANVESAQHRSDHRKGHGPLPLYNHSPLMTWR